MSSSLSVNTLKSYKKQLGGARHLFFPLLSSPCFEELLLSPPKQILTLDVPPNTARSYVVAVMALAKAARPYTTRSRLPAPRRRGTSFWPT